MTLRIENHQLVGELVSHRSTPKHVLGREQDEAARCVLTARSLNIRKGPDASFEPVAAALKIGTEVLLFEAPARWSLVEVVADPEIEGWVSNAHIAASGDSGSGESGVAPRSAVSGPASRDPSAPPVKPKKGGQGQESTPGRPVRAPLSAGKIPARQRRR